jgi:hypothetical protein
VLVDPLTPLRVGDTAPTDTPACLVALDGRLIDCTVSHYGGSLGIDCATDGIAAGMSGSPILNHAGAAIGVIARAFGSPKQHAEGMAPIGMAPRLIANLPGWFLLKLGASNTLSTARRELRAFRRRHKLLGRGSKRVGQLAHR